MSATALAMGGFALSSALGISEAKKNRKFQERMYKSRFQNTVKDLRKAGLNPILAAQGAFGGGSSPGGAQGVIPNMGGIGDTATSARKVASENRLRKEQERQVGAATSESKERAIVARNQAVKLIQETQTSASSMRQIEATTTQIELGLIQAQRRHDIYADPYWGPKLTLLNEVTNSASGALPAGAVGLGGGLLLNRAAGGNIQGPPTSGRDVADPRHTGPDNSITRANERRRLREKRQGGRSSAGKKRRR